MTHKRKAGLLLVVLIVAAVVGVWFMIRRGFSARERPSTLEGLVARTMRALAVPAAAKNEKNLFSATPEIMAEARAHFADHCAICHANDGSGQTPIGQNLYPKAPDMRLPATQELTDGELYYTIHNGIRLTGMPAWGESDPHRDHDSWKLVLFMRRLPSLTPAELKEMQRLNPRSAAELEDERAEQDFLSGEGESSKKQNTKPKHH
ncbi:MAG: c-type cytochrome [Acidobacteriota bacterium]|nr:c-type cytochrome [Acidobacteriota bacterium]